MVTIAARSADESLPVVVQCLSASGRGVMFAECHDVVPVTAK
jgi:hypothetical protein